MYSNAYDHVFFFVVVVVDMVASPKTKLTEPFYKQFTLYRASVYFARQFERELRRNPYTFCVIACQKLRPIDLPLMVLISRQDFTECARELCRTLENYRAIRRYSITRYCEMLDVPINRATRSLLATRSLGSQIITFPSRR